MRVTHRNTGDGVDRAGDVQRVTPEIRRLIHHQAPTHEIRATVQRQGMLSLRDEGVALAIQGATTLEEVLRITHAEDFDGDAEPVRRAAA